MIRRAYNNPRVVVLVLFLIVISGIAGFSTRARLEDPKSSVRAGFITTSMPGATPAEVESRISIPIETALSDIKALRSIEASSMPGVSIISIRLTEEALDVDKSWAAIRDKLSDITDDLPKFASAPLLVSEKRWVATTMVFALVGNSANETEPAVLARWGKEIDSRFRFASGTRFTEVFGLPKEEVLVEVEEETLAATGLTIAEIATKIRQRESEIPEASVQTSTQDLPIRLMGNIDDLNRLGDVVLRGNKQGRQIHLRDIASMTRGQATPAQNVALVDGRRAVVVACRMDDRSHINAWTKSQMEIFDDILHILPSGLEMKVLYSQQQYTDLRSQRLYGSLGLGMAVVVALVWLLMGWRAAIPICAALPLTMLGVFFLMMPFQIELHQMSITGLILALGILIDNPIIVVDNIQRRIESGATPVEALVNSVNHVMRPLVASNATTILAFAPILLLPGPTGEFLSQLGWTVIACLFMSLVLSLTIIPILAAWFLKTTQSEHAGRTSDMISTWYVNMLAVAFRRPVLVVCLSIILPVLGFVFALDLRKQFFPPAERDHFHYSIRIPAFSSIRETERIARQSRELILNHDEVEAVSLFVGANAPKVHYSMIASDENRPNYAQGLVQLKTNRVDPLLIRRIQAELDEALPKAQTIVSLFEQGPPANAPIELRLYGPSREKLVEYGIEARRILMTIPGVVHTRTSIELGGTQIGLDVKQHEANAASISDEWIAQQIVDQLQGVTLTNLSEGIEEIPIRVRLKDIERSSADRVFSLPLISPSGEIIPLDSVAEWSINKNLFNTYRRNASPCNLISAYVAAGELPIDVENEFKKALASSDFQLPTGYRYDFGGISNERDSATGNILAYASICSTLMLTILVMTFGSFRQAAIIGVVGFLSIGLGLFSLWLFNFPIGIVAIIGVLGMMGLAINDSIVVMADCKTDALIGKSLAQSVASSTRHVLATTLTTVAGVTPLILSGGDFWPPMMIVIAGGVVGATLIALGFTPSALKIVGGHKMNPQQVPDSPTAD